MAIPYLLGLAAGSAAVLTWKHFQTKKSALDEDKITDEIPPSEQGDIDNENNTSSATIPNKKKA